MVDYVVLVHLVFLFCSDFAFENLFELIDVVSKEFRHLRDSECGDEGTRAHGFHRPFLEVEDVVELLFNFIQFHCIFLDFPLFLLLCLFDLLFRPLYKLVEVFWVDIEVLFLDLDHIFYFFVLLDDFREAISQLFNFRPDLSLLFFGNLKLPVFFSSELGLLNGIQALIFDVVAGWDLERWRQVCSVKSINVWVDVWEIRGVVLLESRNPRGFNLPDLIFRHEVGSINTFEGIKFTFLLYHELVKSVDEEKSVVGCGDEESLVVRKFCSGDLTDFTVVLLDSEESFWIGAGTNSDLTVLQTNV